jgi:hypothetical protein
MEDGNVIDPPRRWWIPPGEPDDGGSGSKWKDYEHWQRDIFYSKDSFFVAYTWQFILWLLKFATIAMFILALHAMSSTKDKICNAIIFMAPQVSAVAITTEQFRMDLQFNSTGLTFRDFIIVVVTTTICVVGYLIYKHVLQLVSNFNSAGTEWLCTVCGRYNFSPSVECLGCSSVKSKNAMSIKRVERQYLLTHTYESILTQKITTGKYDGKSFSEAMADTEYTRWLYSRSKKGLANPSLKTLINLSQFEMWALDTLHRIEYDGFKADGVLPVRISSPSIPATIGMESTAG